MGGSALKTTETIRLNKDEYFLLEEDVVKKLQKLSTNITPIKAYRNKESFGDMDILIEKNHLFYNNKITEFLETYFQPKEIIRNGSIVSFEYKSFQIDLIFETYDNLEISKFYYGFNDLQNLTGRLYHKFGLKFGFTGLYYPLRTEHGNLSTDILLTKEPRQIYDFLGYDYDRYLQGFDTLEDIFKFVTTSKYFNPNIYLKSEENKSQIDKRREGRRKNYIAFIDWLTEYVNQYPNKEYYEFNKEKTEYVSMIHNIFPEVNLTHEINTWNNQQEKIKMVSEKFNGKLVMTMFPELKGKELGSFITSIKSKVSVEYSLSFEDVILILSSEEIKDVLTSHYKDFNHKKQLYK